MENEEIDSEDEDTTTEMAGIIIEPPSGNYDGT